MIADDRTLLLDLENLGSATLKPRPLRARLETLLSAAGEHHHAIAAYAVTEGEPDPIVSVLAELRVAPLRVRPGPDAAELALLAHARHVHAEGGRIFLVGSADGRFADLAALGRVELLVWEGQPVATKLTDVVHATHRVPRPTCTPVEDPPTVHHAEPEPVSDPGASIAAARPPDHPRQALAGWVVTGLVGGFTVAVGQRLLDLLAPRRRR
ncbi:hypothetical protein [Actinokineospora cianjurensis]|uniref:NYN domain-containing protein n=1 Tax=Actinokineospora cianjurensis TaxID=585224 RepID=A0A421B243_9PSEU|nr:hypothetical protein [Actinokineospora cianjurensis]RLK58427.1 hypothetical protein CLV68_4529 [Actinokineospora cianjurensis]